MVINNSDNTVNKLQINASTEWINGSTVRRSLLLNVRCDSVEEAVQLYKQLKTKLNGEIEDQPAAEKQKNGGKITLCPAHKIPMVLRQNKRAGNFFFGCPRYRLDGKGCNETLPCASGQETEEEIRVEELPF